MRTGGPGRRPYQLSNVGTVVAFHWPPRGEWVEPDRAAIEYRPADRTKKVR